VRRRRRRRRRGKLYDWTRSTLGQKTNTIRTSSVTCSSEHHFESSEEEGEEGLFKANAVN